MQFDDDFDKKKSNRTKKDREIDFLEAREIWGNPMCVDGAHGNVIGGRKSVAYNRKG